MSPSAKKGAPEPAKGSRPPAEKDAGFTAGERDAMKERARELREAGRRKARGGAEGRAEAERELLAKLDEMLEPDRTLGRRLHAIVSAAEPSLEPRTWYGMPAWGLDSKVVCFFQSAQKFKTRYATFGFSDLAKLDDGRLWPTAFALTELTAEEEKRIAELVRRAVG